MHAYHRLAGRPYVICLLFVVVLASADARAGRLFDSGAVLDVELRAPLSTLYRERRQEERDEHAGTLIVTTGAGESLSLAAGVRTRGNFRRNYCRYAPLRINLRKREVAGTAFDGEDKLKLVSPCRSGARYDDIVVAEYLVYKMFELLGEQHFRVRPLTIRFIDTDERAKPRSSFGFFIEDMDDMAARYQRVVPDWPRTEFRVLAPRPLAIVDVFQFMIGGQDWSVVAAAEGERCCHNARLLVEDGETSDVIPVPYDFDMSGFVDAPYSFPPPNVPIKNVRQRYYRGRCHSEALWRETFDHFRDQRPAIERLIAEAEMLASRRKKAARYIDQFYQIIGDQKRTTKLILKRCRSIPGSDQG